MSALHILGVYVLYVGALFFGNFNVESRNIWANLLNLGHQIFKTGVHWSGHLFAARDAAREHLLMLVLSALVGALQHNQATPHGFYRILRSSAINNTYTSNKMQHFVFSILYVRTAAQACSKSSGSIVWCFQLNKGLHSQGQTFYC